MELLGECAYNNNNKTILFFLFNKIIIFRVVELVKDFNLKKLAVMKTIQIKSMSIEDVKVKHNNCNLYVWLFVMYDFLGSY